MRSTGKGGKVQGAEGGKVRAVVDSPSEIIFPSPYLAWELHDSDEVGVFLEFVQPLGLVMMLSCLM